MKKILLSMEGISGTGKTFIINKLKTNKLYNDTYFIKEISNRDETAFESKIINILDSNKNLFFSNGNIYTETLLLLAIKTYDYENIINNHCKNYKFIFEDRSIDTIAIYQSILISKNNSKGLQISNELLKIASFFRPIPSFSFLLIDNIYDCIERAEKRNNRKYLPLEIDILKNAYDLYIEFANHFKDRYMILDRRKLDIDEIITMITKLKQTI